MTTVNVSIHAPAWGATRIMLLDESCVVEELYKITIADAIDAIMARGEE